MKTNNDFTKQLIKECSDEMLSFIRNYTEGKENKKALNDLEFKINCNSIGMPTEVYEEFSRFMLDNLYPMTYELEKSFSKIYSLGYVDRKNIKNVDAATQKTTKVNFLKLVMEEKWLRLARKEIRPYLTEL